MQKQTNLLQAKQFLQILLSISLLTMVAGLLWYASTIPVQADNPPSSVYDGISPSGPVMNPSPVPCTGGEEVLLIQDNIPWFAPINQDPLGANVTELKAQNKEFCIITSDEIGVTNLNQFPEIIISAAQVQAFYNNLFPAGVVHSALTNYAQNGGILSANLTDNASGPGAGGNWDGRTFIGGLTHVNNSPQNNNISDPTHSIITGEFGGANGGQIADTANFQDLDGWNLASHGFFTNLPPNATAILVDALNRPVMIEYPFGNGVVIASQVTNEWRYAGNFGALPQNKKLLANEIGYQDSLVAAPEQMINPTIVGRVYRPFPSYPGHEGIDILDAEEIFRSPVLAVASGRIVRIKRIPTPGGAAGKWIWIFHGDITKVDGTVVPKISTRYLHLDSIDPLLQEEQIVPGGAVIGTVGQTGTTIPHLHFEVRQGDIPVDKDFDKTNFLNPEEFVDYPIPSKTLSILALSPVDLIVTDPEGFVVSKEINELPGLAQYLDIKYLENLEEGEDIQGYDLVAIDERKSGDYLITVIPETDAFPTDVYSLDVHSAGLTKTLAENVLLSDIPDQSYQLRSAETTIEKIIPLKVRIEPETLNLLQRGVFTAFIQISKGFGAAIQDINPDSITVFGAAPAKARINQGINTLIAEFNTQELVGVPTSDEVTLTVTGKLFDNTSFEGSDTIRVIKKGGPMAGVLNILSAIADLFAGMSAKLIGVFDNGR